MFVTYGGCWNCQQFQNLFQISFLWASSMKTKLTGGIPLLPKSYIPAYGYRKEWLIGNHLIQYEWDELFTYTACFLGSKQIYHRFPHQFPRRGCVYSSWWYHPWTGPGFSNNHAHQPWSGCQRWGNSGAASPRTGWTVDWPSIYCSNVETSTLLLACWSQDVLWLDLSPSNYHEHIPNMGLGIWKGCVCLQHHEAPNIIQRYSKFCTPQTNILQKGTWVEMIETIWVDHLL